VLENIFYIVIAIAQVALIVWYVVSNKRKQLKKKAAKKELADKYPFEGLRNLAFNTVPGFIIANAPADEFFIYTIIMDWNIGDDVITLVAMVTGETSLYVKSGGGIIGAGKHFSVSEATQALFFLASTVAQDFETFTETPLPNKNWATFYMLTNRGNLKITDSVAHFESKNSKYNALFTQANKVLSEMKNTSVSN